MPRASLDIPTTKSTDISLFMHGKAHKGLFEPIIPKTAEELERLKPRFVVPCHCSGLKAMSEIARG